MKSSVIIVISTLGVIVSGGVPKIPKEFNLVELGCIFNKNYDALRMSKSYTDMPLWGGPIEGKVFTDSDDFDDWMDTVTNIYSKFLDEEVFNNIDVLIDFFKTCNAKNLETCYDSFVPNSFRVQDGSGLAIKWAHRLIRKDVSFDKYVRLAASQLEPFTGNNSLVPYSTAVFIKLSISNMQGYVLFDPGFGQNRPVTLLRNIIEVNPITTKLVPPIIARAAVWKDAGQDLEYKLAEYKDTNMGTVTWIVGDLPVPTANRINYYLSQAYCSHLNFSVKPAVLSRKHMIVRRNQSGQVTAALSVVLYDSNSTILLEYQTDKKDGNVYRLPISTQLMDKIFKKPENIKFIDLVAKRLKLSGRELRQKIHELGQILRSGIFLSDMATLARKWGMYDEDRGSFWAKKPIEFTAKVIPRKGGLVGLIDQFSDLELD